MHAFPARAGRWLAHTVLAAGALAGRAKEASTPNGAVRTESHRALGDVVTVTSASGGAEVGSLRWAVRHAPGQATIRFDSSLAGATITLDSTLNLTRYVTIEGPEARGITLSGGGVRRVMYIGQGARLSNLTITGGNDPVVGGGIFAYGPLLIENVTLHNNRAGNAAGIYGDKVTVINSTITENTADALASGISWDMDEGLTLVNTAITRNGPAPGIRGHGNTAGTGPVRLENSIIASNGTPRDNCWYPSSNFVRVGLNIADDLTCGDASQMSIQEPTLVAYSSRQ